jgi:uncharacterized membrane protein (DUF373 family)
MYVLDFFERLVVVALLIMMMAAICLSTIDLAWTMLKEVAKPPYLLIEVKKVMEIFGLVFTVLIGLELLETIKTYLAKDQLHVEIVFLVAMIAVARKVIILEIKDVDPLVLVGTAAVILTLSVGFYFVKLTYAKTRPPHSSSDTAK